MDATIDLWTKSQWASSVTEAKTKLVVIAQLAG